MQQRRLSERGQFGSFSLQPGHTQSDLLQNVGLDSLAARLNISCQDIKFDRNIDMIGRRKPGQFLTVEEYETWVTCNLLGSLKK